MNILVFSNAISPYKGSEFSVGWNYVKHMSTTGNRIYVIFGGSKNEKKDIDNYLSVNKLNNTTFIYAGNHQEHVDWARYPLLSYVTVIMAYKKWMKKVYDLALIIIKENDIDVVHYLNPIGFKEPGYLWNLDKPYVWGPVQGVDNFPSSLYPILGKRGLLEAIARRLVLNYMFLFDSRVRKAFKRTDLLIAATPKTKRDLKRFYNRESIYLPENAIEAIERNSPVDYCKGECLNIISVGTLCDRKGFILQLKTVENLLRLGYSNFKWTIVGSGYLEATLKNYSKTHGLDNNVLFTGQVERSEVQNLFMQAHLNVISSLSEATTTVLWEAMAKGIPTMTLDHCGMGGVLSDEDSFKVRLGSVPKVVGAMVGNIIEILDNPSLIEEKSKNTLLTAQRNCWNKRVEIIENIYKKCIVMYHSVDKNK